MGYHIRTGLVEENKEILDLIRLSVKNGIRLRYDCKVPEHMTKLKYQFNRLLRATSILTRECEGNFVGLRAKVQVREDWGALAIIIQPATNGPVNLSTLVPVKPNEHDALETLKQFEGQMDLVRFTPSPSFDLELWRTALMSIGFDLMPNPDEPGEWIGGALEDGDHEYAVARVEEKRASGFGLLDAFDGSGDMPPDA